MAKQTINIGQTANDRTGDNLRTAFNKVNSNFNELYSTLAADGTIFDPSNVDTHLLPKTNNTYDIGSPTRQWRSMYVGLNTLYINNVPISLDGNGNLTVDGDPVQGGSGSNLQSNSAIDITVGSHPLVQSVTIFAADTFGPGVWRLFVLDSDYPTLGTTVTAGATVRTAWGTPVTATVQTVIHDTGAGYWVFTFNQNVITGFSDGPKTATFGPGINTWTFGTDGTLTFPDNSGDGWPINEQRFGMGNIGAWLDGEWTIGEFSGNGVGGTVGIRIDPAIEGSTGITLPGSANASTQPVQIYSTAGSGIGLYTGNNWLFKANGQTVLPFISVARGDTANGTITGYTLNIGDGQQEAIITTPDATSYNAQRLVINPGKGQDGTGGEGGDIYLWAGRGGDTNGNGGDIKIRGGYGPGDGQGGYIRVEAGDVQGSGTPGYIYQKGGDVNIGTGGYIQSQGGQGTTGGYISLAGGYGTDGPGGDVTITGGQSAGGLSYYGKVLINAGASQWQFKNDGKLQLPSGGDIVNSDGTSVLGGGGGGLSYIYNTNPSRYVITAYHRDTETEEYWVEVRGLDFFNEVDGLAGPNVTVMVRLLQDAPGVYRAISGSLDTTTTYNTTRINLADIADINYVGSYITTVCRYLNKSQITNGDNIQLRLVDNRIEISNNTGRIYGVENSLILKADQDFAWSEDYGLELYYSFDNDTHLRPLSRKKGAALGFGYGSYGSHIRVEGSQGQQGQPNSGDRVVIYSSREQVSHVYTNGQDFSNEVTLTSPNVLIPGLSQRNQSEIEVNIFTDPNGELGGTLLGLSIGAKIEFTYNKVGAGRADIIGYVSQAFQTIAQGDPENPSRARISGRVNNQVPADYASIWQVNIPDANSNRSAEWVFGNDGSLLLPNHTKIGTYGMGWTGITNTTDQQSPISIASVSSNVSNRGTELSSIMVYGSGQNDLTGVVDFYTHDLLRNNHYNWTFTSDGRTKFPDDKIKSDNTHGLAIETNENPTAPPTHITILGADFVAVNLTYTQSISDPNAWIPAGYNPATDPYIQYDNGYGIWVPGFNQALYVNTGPLNTPYEQWDTNPPLGSIAPTGTYDYSNIYTHTWEFKNYGMLRFPGGGYLNVKAIPPAHSYGAEGDRIGMMAFDGDYIYYCVQNFEMLNVVGTTGSNHDHFDFGVNYGFNKINTDILGWTLVVPGQSASVTVTNVDQNLNNGTQTGLNFSNNVTFTLTNTFTFVSPGGDIWKRVAWSNGSW